MAEQNYMRPLNERMGDYLDTALRGHEIGNFEKFDNTFLVDDFLGLIFKFEFPQQLSSDSTTRITVSTIPANLKDAKTPERISEGLENILASLKSLLAKRDELGQKGYHGEFYQNEKRQLEEIGYVYTVQSATEEEIKHAIDDFIL